MGELKGYHAPKEALNTSEGDLKVKFLALPVSYPSHAFTLAILFMSLFPDLHP